MKVHEALSLMLRFGIFILTLLSFIVVLITVIK
ncbi:putative holin-like toxin [Chengkuizengella sediminis]|nr:putative holin-like toxin [Chengkuizengella sediminis]